MEKNVNAIYKCIFECNMHQIVQCNMCRWVVYLCNWQNIATMCVCVSEEVDSRNVTHRNVACVWYGSWSTRTQEWTWQVQVSLCALTEICPQYKRGSWQTFSNNTPCAASEIFLWIQAMSLVWSRHMHPWPDRGRVHAGRSVPEQQETERLASANISTTLTQNYHLHTARHINVSSK